MEEVEKKSLDEQPFPAFEPDPVKSEVVEQVKLVEKPTKLVPVELKNVNLLIELRVPAEAGEEFGRAQQIIAELKKKFGTDTLIDELSQLLSGTIEKVSISYPDNAAPVRPAQQAPVAVSIPQTGDEIGRYAIQSACPWKGMTLTALDPAGIYKILYDPAAQAHRSILSQQDLKMMEAFYRHWYESQQRQVKPTQQSISFDDDEINF